MKKLLAILITVFITASLFCLTTSAAEPSADTLIRVSALTKDGNDIPVVIEDHANFETGWNKAINLAKNSSAMVSNGYTHIVVDLYADWKGTDGKLSREDGDGFSEGAIHFPANVSVTLNLNGHTINRSRTTDCADGEVIYIHENADVIINNGTITGGWSNSGAGGIHIDDDASVTLNDVNVIGNCVARDDGGGIALYDGATLTMNGGSISNNFATSNHFTTCYGAALFVDDSTAVLKNVTINNNQSEGTYECIGAALYAKNSDVTLDTCSVTNNGIEDTDFTGAYSIIYIDKNSSFSAMNTTFSGNGAHESIYYFSLGEGDLTPDVLFDVLGSLSLDTCTITGNRSVYLIDSSKADLQIFKGTFENNNSIVFRGDCKEGRGSTFTECTFKNNDTSSATFNFHNRSIDLTFVDCAFNNSTFSNKNAAKFVNTGAGSLFGEGSLTTVVAFLALIVAIASMSVNLSANKNNKVVSAKKADEDDE